MRKLIIIDDERATRESLVDYIEWKKLGIEFSGDAEDGVFGLELARQVGPDIVLIDVRMPRLNGIECARGIRQALPECKIIFMSGYSDKEYLKSAIQLQAIDYVEKPIDYDELHAVLKKAMLLCREEEARRVKETEMLSRAEKSAALIRQELTLELVHRNMDLAAVKKQFEDIHLDIPLNENYLTVLIQVNRHKGLDPGNNFTAGKDRLLALIDAEFGRLSGACLAGIMDHAHIVLHVYGKMAVNILLLREALKNIRSGLNTLYQIESFVTVGAGKPVRGIENIPESYQRARKAVQMRFLKGYDSIIFYDEESGDKAAAIPEESAERVRQHIKSMDMVNAVNYIEALAENIKKARNPDVNGIKNFFLTVMLQVSQAMKEAGAAGAEENMELLWAELLNVCTLDEVKAFLADKLMLLSAHYEEQRGKSRKIRAAMDFIRQHYNEGISVAKIAEKIGMGLSYLCTQFKKETGKTINEYIEEIRIEKARELLKDDSMKLNEVARRVGYSNANYFTTVFRKVTGIYPSDYRRNILS